MTPAQDTELRIALYKAFEHAIKVVGFAMFKSTSLFASNRKQIATEKEAA